MATSKARPVVTMPFGKFKDLPLADLPDSYLRWLRDNVQLREPLRSALYGEWHKRFGDDDHDQDRGANDDLDGDERALLGDVIAAGFRTLYFKHRQRPEGDEQLMRLWVLAKKLGLLAA
jgi:hypothetical protein